MRVPGQLHDALGEAAVVADESGEHGGQTAARSVQHHGGGGFPDGCFGAAALCDAPGGKNAPNLQFGASQ